MRHKRVQWLVCLLGCILLGASCTEEAIRYKGFTPSASTLLAVRDLETCLEKFPQEDLRTYTLCLDKDLKDGQFGYRIQDGNVTFSGGDELSVTHAVYTFLEKMGYTFDFAGITSPREAYGFSQPYDTLVTPAVRYRGIRQHVNFPMDISSYSITEAKAYLETLVRMRFNKLVIHSYPGQWYETHIGDSVALAGHFFYGDVHYLYDSEFLKEKIPQNDSIFCIPEAEACFHDDKARSRFAVRWMQELVDYAKDLGFYVQFSFEPRMFSSEQAVRTAKEIKATYPRIDALELITEETGGWGPACTEDEVRNTLSAYFPQSIASDTSVTAPIRPRQTDLNALYKQIGIIVQTIQSLQNEGNFGTELKMGIYSTIASYTKGAYRLARLSLPDTPICLMPSHGSNGTADAVSSLIRTADDLRHTELYSWIEFDGLMYLYQNSINGNERLMEHVRDVLPQEPFGSLCCNHWRTAENRTSARYVAEAALSGVLSDDTFYSTYASRLGIKDEPSYRESQRLISLADNFARIHLGNIGFCWMGAWRSGGSFASMNKQHIQTARNFYFQAGEQLGKLLAETDKGSPAYSYLNLIGNRVLCSVLYLDAFSEAVGIQTIRRTADGDVPPSEQQRAQEICNRALLLFDQYMETHARMMPDRGCSGTLVSIWNAPIHGLKVYRSRLAGVDLETPVSEDKSVDAPPLPIFYEGIID